MSANATQTKERDTLCWCPFACVIGEVINREKPEDSVLLVCSDVACKRTVLAHQQQASTQPVACECGLGYFTPSQRVTPTLLTQKSSEDDQQWEPVVSSNSSRRRRRRNSSRVFAFVTANQTKTLDSIAVVLPGRSRARTMSCSTTGTPSHVHGLPVSPPNLRPNTNGLHERANRVHSDSTPNNSTQSFFTDPQVKQNGSIFASRDDMSDFYSVLPAHKVNGFHIKMEDDCPQGNDDTRIFALTNLGRHNQRRVQCVVCLCELVVFARYPLLNGTFFISPVNHRGHGTALRYDSRPAFLHALCMKCCEQGSAHVQCGRCGRTGWLPQGTLLLGGVYSFDVLSCVWCCAPQCHNCANPMPVHNRSFAGNSECCVCQCCGARDYHYIRRIEHCVYNAPAATGMPAGCNQSVVPAPGTAIGSSSVSSCTSSTDECSFVIESSVGRGLLRALDDTSPSAFMQTA